MVSKSDHSQWNLIFIFDLFHSDSDAEAYSEEYDNKWGSTDFSFHHAPRNSNRVDHDHQGKRIIFVFVSNS
jgi:hypothetical protein